MILVTHQVQHLKDVKNILVIESGKIKMRGSYSELKNQGLDFDAILKTYEKKTENKDEIFGDENDENVLLNNPKTKLSQGKEEKDFLPPISGAEPKDDENSKELDETNLQLKTGNKVHPIDNKTEEDLVDKSKAKSDVKIIEKEKVIEGEVPCSVW